MYHTDLAQVQYNTSHDVDPAHVSAQRKSLFLLFELENGMDPSAGTTLACVYQSITTESEETRPV